MTDYPYNVLITFKRQGNKKEISPTFREIRQNNFNNKI